MSVNSHLMHGVVLHIITSPRQSCALSPLSLIRRGVGGEVINITPLLITSPRQNRVEEPIYRVEEPIYRVGL